VKTVPGPTYDYLNPCAIPRFDARPLWAIAMLDMSHLVALRAISQDFRRHDMVADVGLADSCGKAMQFPVVDRLTNRCCKTYLLWPASRSR
jgi:hypothetical protein